MTPISKYHLKNARSRSQEFDRYMYIDVKFFPHKKEKKKVNYNVIFVAIIFGLNYLVYLLFYALLHKILSTYQVY